jgi:hypothetical protein
MLTARVRDFPAHPFPETPLGFPSSGIKRRFDFYPCSAGILPKAINPMIKQFIVQGKRHNS